MVENAAPFLQATGISKSFGGVPVLQDVDFACHRGEVHALVGENGAGKSTLSHIISGVLRPDRGEIRLDGKAVRLEGPAHARHLGISMVFQEFGLIPCLTVAENMFLGREPARLSWLEPGRMVERARTVFERIGQPGPDPRLRVEQLSVATQQMVEIARSLAFSARIIIMDEPTAALSESEVARLATVVQNLRQSGVGIIYVSHRLDEVFRLADRVTVLKDGLRVHTGPVADLDRERLVNLMVGRELGELFPPHRPGTGQQVLLSARGLARPPYVGPVDLDLHAGEILGVAGLAGAGRSRLAKVLFGAEPATRGEITVGGRPVTLQSPLQAMSAGIGYVTEDRKRDGLALPLEILANATATILPAITRWGVLQANEEERQAGAVLEYLRLRAVSLRQPVSALSGGNQQKVVLAKWLLRDPRILILDEPTRGVDVGTKREIYSLMQELRARGVGILLISSELPELIGMCDRVIVLHLGRVTVTLNRDELSEERIMRAAAGLDRDG